MASICLSRGLFPFRVASCFHGLGGEQGEKKVPIVWTMKVEQSSQRRKMLDAGAELRAERGERGER